MVGSGDHLEVRVAHRPDHVELRLVGELTLATAERLADRLDDVERSAPPLVAIDLRAVRFIDSNGLAQLVGAHRRSRERRGRLLLVTAPGPVERLLALTRLDREFETATEPPSAP